MRLSANTTASYKFVGHLTIQAKSSELAGMTGREAEESWVCSVPRRAPCKTTCHQNRPEPRGGARPLVALRRDPLSIVPVADFSIHCVEEAEKKA